jgi:IclR family transcriptional regulator, KDG regulon repressor
MELISSAQNTARVLVAFTDRPGARGVSELSRKLDIGKSTVHRILSALVAERLLEHDPITRTYRLSLMAVDLAAAATAPLQLHDVVIPHLVRLHQRTGQTVHVGVLDGADVVYIEQLASHRARSSPTAPRLSAHYSSCGKAIMAYLPDATLDALLATHRFDVRTPHTIVDRHQFRRALRMIRARGWSRTVNESEMGVASIGAPVLTQRGEVLAAVDIVRRIPLGREEDLRCYVKPLLLTARAISQTIKSGPRAAVIPTTDQRIFHTKPNGLAELT